MYSPPWLANSYGTSVSQIVKWPRILSVCRNHNPLLSSFITYPMVCSKSNTTDATSRTGTTFLSGAHHRFLVRFVLPIVVFLQISVNRGSTSLITTVHHNDCSVGITSIILVITVKQIVVIQPSMFKRSTLLRSCHLSLPVSWGLPIHAIIN